LIEARFVPRKLYAGKQNWIFIAYISAGNGLQSKTWYLKETYSNNLVSHAKVALKKNIFWCSSNPQTWV
jgi:hypothetical protein